MARGVDVLRAIDQSETLRSKSSLEAWMRENHDAFATRLSERIADWGVLVKLFADAQLTDRSGRPPKPETARKTWQRVRKAVAVERAADEKAPKPPARQPVPAAESTPRLPAAVPTLPTTTAPGKHDAIRSLLSTGRKLPDPI